MTSISAGKSWRLLVVDDHEQIRSSLKRALEFEGYDVATAGSGAHINVSGGGMLKASPHKTAAVKFLEYLASDEAQRYFADGNNEWPVVASVKMSNPALDALGKFKADPLPVGTLAMYRAKAQVIFDRAGYR